MSDKLVWYVKVGNTYLNYKQFDMYVRHCFKDHENDIMGWDLLRGCFHDLVKRTASDECWDSENDAALDQMVDSILSCPVCHKVPMYNSKWYCTHCQRQMKLKDVVNALEDLRKTTGIKHILTHWEE
jgi:hypothetical protein